VTRAGDAEDGREEQSSSLAARPSRRRRLVAAGAVLGIGLGGFFDGIVFHQVLQWHHMVSSAVPPTTLDNLRVDTLADGLFHLAAWIVTVIGIWLLLLTDGERHRRRGGRALGGAMIGGWGTFNLVEGVVDHYLLQIHHVRPGPDQAVYDVAFLAWGVLFLVVGGLVVRSALVARPPS
jgi:uncharacterized membrane protein